jgi:hypothetical protein
MKKLWRVVVWSAAGFIMDHYSRRYRITYDNPQVTGYPIPLLDKSFDSLAAAKTFVAQAKLLRRGEQLAPTEYRRKHQGLDCKIKLDSTAPDIWFVEVTGYGAVYSRVAGIEPAFTFALAAAEMLAAHKANHAPRKP